MGNATELLDVIAVSLPVSDRLEQHRRELVGKVEVRFQGMPDRSEKLAQALTDLLVEEGVVLSDTDTLRDLVLEYLEINKKQSALGQDEMDFLNEFLK